MNRVTVHTTVNKRVMTVEVDPRATLLTLLRESLGLTGTKCGCEVGECGACTVLVDGSAVHACLVPAPQIDGRTVATVEGLSDGDRLSPLQEAFLDRDAVHCGFCTPGLLMSARDLLDHNSDPTEEQIRTAISGNLCRCTGYMQVVDAIAEAARREAER